MSDIVKNTYKTISKTSKEISYKYEEFLRKRAIQKVDKKIISKGLRVEDIEIDDYETLIEEEVKEIKREYATNSAKIALAALGIDFLLW
jgi:hypothetical protein